MIATDSLYIHDIAVSMSDCDVIYSCLKKNHFLRNFRSLATKQLRVVLCSFKSYVILVIVVNMAYVNKI